MGKGGGRGQLAWLGMETRWSIIGCCSGARSSEGATWRGGLWTLANCSHDRAHHWSRVERVGVGGCG